MQPLLLALAMLLGLSGCSAGQVLDKLPESLGTPANAPARPAVPYDYPAVHDMPAQRSAPMLDEDQQIKLERDLAAARDRVRGQAATDRKSSDGTPAQAGAR